MKNIIASTHASLLPATLLFLVLFGGCTGSSTTTSDDPNSASIAGAWSLKSIQCLSVPTEDFPCWKSFLVPLGEIDMQSNMTAILTISADGTYSGDEVPRIDTLPGSIFGCEVSNPHTSKQHIDGTYSASEGLIILHVVHYTVNGVSQTSADDAISGSYTISGPALSVTLDLGGGERWKVNFTK